MLTNLSQHIITQAEKLGFDACGVAKADFLEDDAEKVEKWLSENCQGEMDYLTRNKEKRYDPRLLNEGTKTVVSVLCNYYPKQILTSDNNYKISKYAYGDDYHEVVKQKLRQLLEKIELLIGKLENTRIFVDSAPVLERAWAVRCGLGFIGKNTCLIHPKKAHFFHRSIASACRNRTCRQNHSEPLRTLHALFGCLPNRCIESSVSA